MQLSQIKKQYRNELGNDRSTEQLFSRIAEFLLKQSKIQLLLEKDQEVEATIYEKFCDILTQLLNNRPIQYILGIADFYGMELTVNNKVLIPRPETEELVDWILKEHKNTLAKVLDIGTGSGCIALALKKHATLATVYGMDVSEEALRMAEKNAQMLNLEIKWLQQDILNNFDWKLDPLDVIVSNPPYIPLPEQFLMNPSVLEYEPHLALFVKEEEPLLFYDKIADFAQMHLKPKGQLFFELNEFNASKVLELMQQKGFVSVQIQKDLQGKERMLKANKI